MSTTIKTVLATALAAASLCLPTLSSAAMSPMERAASALQSAAAIPSGSLLKHLAETLPSEHPEALLPGDRATPYAPPARLLAGSGYSGPLRAHSDLALWNLVATVHAQQKHQAFELVDAGISTTWDFEREKVSAVPLPGAIWLFIMGILGLAGTRITGTSGVARQRETEPAFGALAAA